MFWCNPFSQCYQTISRVPAIDLQGCPSGSLCLPARAHCLRAFAQFSGFPHDESQCRLFFPSRKK